MTEPLFFCSQTSRESGVDIIGSAYEHRLYVAIECPPPWTSDDMESKGIPDNLRELSQELYDDYDRFQTRFLLIHNEHLQQENLVRVLFFRKPSGLSRGYIKQEFHLMDINQVASLVRSYVMGEAVDATPVDDPNRDILICTHGSRDRCCSRFGNPLYRQALKIVEERSLSSIRIWQASHIGGHRMAPTAIDFPEARYYGYLDTATLASILTRTGDIQALNTTYRGWGVLPWAAQVLEKEFLLRYGWEWLTYSVTAQVLEHDVEETFNRVELRYTTCTGNRHLYHADVIANLDKTVYLKGSCNSEKASEVTPYDVKNLVEIETVVAHPV